MVTVNQTFCPIGGNNAVVCQHAAPEDKRRYFRSRSKPSWPDIVEKNRAVVVNQGPCIRRNRQGRSPVNVNLATLSIDELILKAGTGIGVRQIDGEARRTGRNDANVDKLREVGNGAGPLNELVEAVDQLFHRGSRP